jgi:hypothetical protein
MPKGVVLVSGSEKVVKKVTSKPKAAKPKVATAKPKPAAKTKAAAKPVTRAKAATPASQPKADQFKPTIVVAGAETIDAAASTAPAKPVALEGLPPVSDAVPATPKLVQSSSPAVQGPEMKKRELVDAVVKRSGVKKKDAKQVVEAMLAVLGESLAEARELNLQPLGRLKVTRVKQTNGGQVLICKLRQNEGGEKADKEALAEDDD